jgi:hypothetical protein
MLIIQRVELCKMTRESKLSRNVLKNNDSGSIREKKIQVLKIGVFFNSSVLSAPEVKYHCQYD